MSAALKGNPSALPWCITWCCMVHYWTGAIPCSLLLKHLSTGCCEGHVMLLAAMSVNMALSPAGILVTMITAPG